MTSNTDDNAQEPSAEEIESALKKTGFLLEQQVAKTLRGRKQGIVEVTLNDAYPDPESGKSREIDVYADFYEFIQRKPEISVQASISLVIECKNSSGPFVIIGDRGQDVPWMRDFGVVSFDTFSLGFEKARHKSIARELKLEDLPGLPTRKDFTGRQLLRLNRHGGDWRADNNSIYDSILYPLAKAWRYKMDFLDREKETSPGEYWQIPTIRFVLPVVVTSGQLYTVDATDDNVRTAAAKWATIKRTFNSKEINGDLWADVVPFSYWDEYLSQKIIKIFQSMQDALTKNIHLYDPEWMVAHFGAAVDQNFFSEWLAYHQSQRERPQ